MAMRYRRFLPALLLIALSACAESAVEPLSDASIPDNKKWQWLYPDIPSNDLNDVWADAAGAVVVVGDAGTILRRHNGVWATMDAHVNVDLRAVHGTGVDNIFAVGDRGTILHFNGRYWYPMDSGGTDSDFIDVWASTPTSAVTVGENGTVEVYDGTRWRIVFETQPGQATYYGVWSGAPNEFFFTGIAETPAGRQGIVVQSDGRAFTPLTPFTEPGNFGTIFDVWGTGSDNLYVVGNVVDSLGNELPSRLHHYDGQTWMVHDSLRASDLWGRSANDIYLVGQGTHHFNGQSWTDVPCNEINLSYIYGTATELIAVGGDRIGTYDGARCERVEGDRRQFLDVWGAAADDVYAASTGGLMHYDGRSWQDVDTGPYTFVIRMDGRSATDIMLTTYNGVVRFDGNGWTFTKLFFDRNVTDVWLDPLSPQAVALTYDSVAVFDGALWETFQLPNTPERRLDYVAVWGADMNHVLAISLDGPVARYDGSEWIEIADASAYAPLFCIWGTAGDDLYVGANGGIIHFDGENWTLRYRLIRQWIFSLWGDGKGELFGVGEFGNIIHITPEHTRYFPRSTNNDLLGVWGSSADNVFAVGRGGTILRYGY